MSLSFSNVLTIGLLVPFAIGLFFTFQGQYANSLLSGQGAVFVAFQLLTLILILLYINVFKKGNKTPKAGTTVNLNPGEQRNSSGFIQRDQMTQQSRESYQQLQERRKEFQLQRIQENLEQHDIIQQEQLQIQQEQNELSQKEAELIDKLGELNEMKQELKAKQEKNLLLQQQLILKQEVEFKKGPFLKQQNQSFPVNRNQGYQKGQAVEKHTAFKKNGYVKKHKPTNIQKDPTVGQLIHHKQLQQKAQTKVQYSSKPVQGHISHPKQAKPLQQPLQQPKKK
jgi:hypothetical protein